MDYALHVLAFNVLKDWTPETMNKYLKHQSSLLAKRKSKRRRLERENSAEGTLGGL